jgi:hypothetical protein
MIKLNKIGKIGKKDVYEDDKGYWYAYHKTSYQNLVRRNTENPNKFFRNIFTRHNIIQYLINNDINLILISGIKEVSLANSHTKLKFKCVKHGTIHNIGWNSVANTNSGCPICGDIIYRRKRRNSYGYIKERYLEKGFILTDKNYGNNQHMMSCVCAKHNEPHRASLTEIITGSGIVCKKCELGRIEVLKNKSDEKFFKEFKPDEYPSELLETSMYGKTHVLVRCKTCDDIRTQKRSHFLNKHSCSTCATKSRGEDSISFILSSYGIDFKTQKRFKDCKNEKALPFDFYIEHLNVLIEFDGKQHFTSVNRWGGEDGYVRRKKHDEIKNNYCNDNNIKLIRIPYWDFDNIEKILIKELNLKGEQI